MSGDRLLVLVLCVTALCCVTTASARYTANRRDGPGVPLLTFKLKRITQELTDQGHRIRLYLEGSQMPTVYLLGNLTTDPEQLQIQSGGIVEFYGDSADIILLHPQGFHNFQINLENPNISEQLVPDVEIFMPEGREVTFQRAQDAEVNVTFAVDEAKIQHLFTYYGFSMRSETEDHIVMAYQEPLHYPLIRLNSDYMENEKFLYLRAMTSSGEVEGLLELDFSVILDCGGENQCIMSRYSVHEDVPVYQNDHAGAFPEHFIGLVKPNYEENPHEQICSVHDDYPCMVLCPFMGDHPSPVEIVPTARDAGRLIPVSRLSFANGGYRAFGRLVFENIRAGDEGEFQCRSRSGPEEVSHTIRVYVVHEARIISSNVTRPDNETVEASCITAGTPRPTLTFYDANGTAMSNVSSDSYEIVMTQLNESTSKGVLRIFDPAVANDLRDVECMAENEVNGRHYNDSGRLYIGSDELPPSVRYYLQNIVNQSYVEE